MPSESKTTTNHDEIRRWVEAHDGKPAKVKGTGQKAGILRIDFPGGDEDSLETIDWDTWFNKFDEDDLAFLYQAKKADGSDSTFCKLVSR